jgi:NADPH2 dehydrogenase
MDPDMRMDDPVPTYTYLVEKIKQEFPDLAYLHVIEPRVNGAEDREPAKHESNDFLRKIWAPRPFLSAGGYTRELGMQVADEKGDLIVYGRYFLSTVSQMHEYPLTISDSWNIA